MDHNGHFGFDLSGQVAIVTGAATGIGEAIARRLAAAGASIGVVDLNLGQAQAVARSLDNGSLAVEADVGDRAAVERCVETVLAAKDKDRHPGEQCRHRGSGSADLGTDG